MEAIQSNRRKRNILSLAWFYLFERLAPENIPNGVEQAILCHHRKFEDCLFNILILKWHFNLRLTLAHFFLSLFTIKFISFAKTDNIESAWNRVNDDSHKNSVISTHKQSQSDQILNSNINFHKITTHIWVLSTGILFNDAKSSL